MMRDVDQQVLFLEGFDDSREHDGDDFERGGGHGDLRD